MRFSTLALVTLFSWDVQAEPPNAVKITTGEYPPFTSKADKSNSHLNTVVIEAFAKEGIRVQFYYFPWARAYHKALTGGFDATSYWYPSEERKEHFYYSNPVVDSPTYFFHLKARPLNWENIQDLKGKLVGATRGYTYTTEFVRAGNENLFTFQWGNSDEQNFRMLLAGRTDIFPIEIYPAYYQLKKHFSSKDTDKLTFHEKPLVDSSGYILFPKKSQHSEYFLKQFNNGLEKLKKSGRFDEIYSKIGEGLEVD